MDIERVDMTDHGSGIDEYVVRNSQARWASNDLRDAMREQFVMFERAHGLNSGEGQHLLMNTGVAL